MTEQNSTETKKTLTLKLKPKTDKPASSSSETTSVNSDQNKTVTKGRKAVVFVNKNNTHSSGGFRDRKPGHLTPNKPLFFKTAKTPFGKGGFKGPTISKDDLIDEAKNKFQARQQYKKKRDFSEASSSKPKKMYSEEDSSTLNVSIGMVGSSIEEMSFESEAVWRKNRNAGRRGFDPSKILPKEVQIYDGIIVRDLALASSIGVKDLMYKLRKMGVKVNANDTLDVETAETIMLEFGHTVKVMEIVDVMKDPIEDYIGDAKARPPIVTIVGHVDHGKTSLLDKIREASVVSGEAGGITQHIGAYQAKSTKGDLITFLDTPGHEAFTSMRLRGVTLTDIAILVVAADDGVQEQTIEAVSHIKSAGVPVIVAITKMDKPDANPTKIKTMLLHYGIAVEEMSGDVLCVEVSAHTGTGIEKLLDTIILQSDMLELKARSEGHAVGVVLESSIKKGFGANINTIIQKGELKVGDVFVSGTMHGKVKSIINHEGKQIKIAGPSTPVSIVGAKDIAQPGDRLVTVSNEDMAKKTVQARIDKQKAEKSKPKSLEDIFSVGDDNMKTLNIIIKADTLGSAEALQQRLEKIENDEVKIKIIMSNAGAISETDIMLAETTNSTIISFHNKVTNTAKQLASQKGIHIITENIIYAVTEKIENLMKNLMDPVFEDEILGKAEVIKLFEFSKGTIAGSKVVDGKIVRNARIRVWRNEQEITTAEIKSLQREMQNVKECIKGQELGLMLEGFNEFKLGDILECYQVVQKN